MFAHGDVCCLLKVIEAVSAEKGEQWDSIAADTVTPEETLLYGLAENIAD